MTVHPQLASAARSRVAVVGAVLLVTALVLSARIAWEAAPLAGEANIARWAQGFPAALDVARPVNTIGQYQWQMLVAGAAISAALLASRRASRHDWLVAGGVFLLVGLLMQLDSLLKELIASPRPSMTYGIEAREQARGFGFPSGHTFGDVLVFGAFAYLAPLVLHRHVSVALRVAALALVVLAGPSRIVAGAHWPSDVVGGYLWGFAILILAIVAAETFARWRHAPQPVPVTIT